MVVILDQVSLENMDPYLSRAASQKLALKGICM
uniref:Uncharacterized protein n=1 Tax=Anguilla anguilla TaxID=7936 RepID=A0A0E9R4E2_ANGAN